MTTRIQKNKLNDDTYSLWIYYWFLYFQRNENYKAYCDARRGIIDTITCVQFEKKYPRIAQLFENWHDIYFLEDGTSLQSDQYDIFQNFKVYQLWLVKHRHLFYQHEPKAEIITDLSNRKALIDHLLINVPLSHNQSDVQRMVKNLIDDYYDNNKIYPAQLSRYALHEPNKKLNKGELIGVQKTYFVGFTKEAGELNNKLCGRKKWSRYDTALVICNTGEQNLGGFSFDWLLPEDEINIDGDDVKQIALANRAKQVKTYEDQYAALVRNTIHGKFPCRD